MNKQLCVIWFFLICSSWYWIHGQELTSLTTQKKELLKKIYHANSLLKSYDQKKAKSITQIRLYDRQIMDREKLILLYSQELDLLNVQIEQLSSNIKNIELELQQLKVDYARLVCKAFQNRKVYNQFTFFLGAESFNAAYRKYILLTEYNKFRKNQGFLIERKRDLLNIEYAKLEVKRDDKSAIITQVESEKKELKVIKHSHQSNIVLLKKKERQIRRELKKQQKALKVLEENILRLVNEVSKGTVVTNFREAKGTLSWPVLNGLVISKFGEHQHPVLKYVKVNNNGIDIKSIQTHTVTSVFKGEISRIVGIPGYNKAVIIRHGKYLTVYANLISVYVKPGAIVEKNSIIGTIYRGEGENSGVLHFELWEENMKINPEIWLSK
ncbi:MAG: peptidoglycan DD-metalloendopeptidase family protein [Marinilabiliaceae bacterium]|nr:peptidoglycan DD-metalloendopeptidase family protein [Marinilabiliaceae bacterium]